VVHGVDDDLSGERVARKLAEAVRWDGEDDDVGIAHDLVGRRGACAGGEHVDCQRDLVGRAGSRDRDVVAGIDRGAGKCRAELARADDAESQILAGTLALVREFDRFDGCAYRVRAAVDASSVSGAAASSSRTRGITSRP
jgi:hypothetical protein